MIGLEGHRGTVFGVAFSPDGKTLASGSRDGMVIVWDVATGRKRATLDGHPSKWVWSVAFSPDGTCLASAGGDDGTCLWGQAVLWDTASWQKRALLPKGAVCVAFSPDGKTLASGIHGAALALWDPVTARKTADLAGPVKFFWLMAFSPDGKTLASCNSEGSVTFWDTVRGQERARLHKSQRHVYSLAFSPDGRTLAAGADNGEVELWHTASEREVAAQDPGPEYLIELAGEATWQARLLQEQGRNAEAQEACFNAIALYESAAQSPGHSECSYGLMQTYGQLLKLVTGRSQLAARDRSRALVLADKAIELARSDPTAAPEEAALWLAKGELLQKAGTPEEALAAMTKAIEVAGASTNSRALQPAEARLCRASLLLRMNRLAEAAADCRQALRIAPRAPRAGSNLVDLSPFYNANWMQSPRDSLGALPTGIQTLAGSEFDIRGLIRLAGGRDRGNHSPASVMGIPVHRKFTRLHVLHGSSWNGIEPKKIGAYVLHYADGQRAELPILYGQDVRDWWQSADSGNATRANVAWTAPNPEATGANAYLRLFKRTWENPRPDAEVESLDFTSTLSESAPFLVALTVE